MVAEFVQGALFASLFGAIYKVPPDAPLAGGDVATGSFVMAALFTPANHQSAGISATPRQAAATGLPAR
jgi:hypothetical protein